MDCLNEKNAFCAILLISYIFSFPVFVSNQREEALLVRKGYSMKPFVAFLSVSKAPLAVVS